MYAVVGCSECSHLWLLEGRSETTQCPRCGSRRAYEKRKKFVETEDADHARDVRASMLANRQGEGQAFAKLDSSAALETRGDGGVIDETAYLEASGHTAKKIDAAGERDPRSPTRRGSKKDVVNRALEELEDPTEDEIVQYAGNRGVSAEYVRKALEKLSRHGEVSEQRGQYRAL